MIREVLFTFFRLRAAGDELFADVGQTPGKVSLMRSILEEGPQSVAQIARARPVARQGVQRMADQLAAEGLVEYADNPAHMRAKLVKLTARGRAFIAAAIADEMRWARALAREFDQREVATVLNVMRKLNAALARSRARRAHARNA
jgi:DNA-binding MarR family transcriptional regulator